MYLEVWSGDDVWMVDVDLSGGVGAGLRRVVEETLEAGASVAKVALKYGGQREPGVSMAAFVSGWQAGCVIAASHEVVVGERSR